MKIGCHVSIAGGVANAPERAFELGCETFQIFSRSPQSYRAPEITDQDVKDFWSAMKKYKIDRFYIHAPYLVNLASLNNKVRHGSISILRTELERGTKLGAKYVIAHIGSAKGQEKKDALKTVREGVGKILDGYTGTCQLLLEISAGSGEVIGDTFDEIAFIMKGNKHQGLGGVCFDTCHAFASGYKLDAATFEDFDSHIGLKNLKVMHANDSKFAFGERKDRHEHIGEGFIGKEIFRSLIKKSYLKNVDWLLETKHDRVEQDIKLLKKFRK